jgi:hypothetical protein
MKKRVSNPPYAEGSGANARCFLKMLGGYVRLCVRRRQAWGEDATVASKCKRGSLGNRNISQRLKDQTPCTPGEPEGDEGREEGHTVPRFFKCKNSEAEENHESGEERSVTFFSLPHRRSLLV